MRAKFWPPRAGVVAFVLCVTLANLVLYQKPLIWFAVSVSSLPERTGWLEMISLMVVQFGLLAGFLYFVSTFSVRLLKGVCTVFALTNAAALYFMLTYNMELDRSMIANIFNTDGGEASGLWHWTIIPYVALLGLLPAGVIWWVEVVRPKRYLRFSAGIVSFGLLIGWLFATSSTWLWYDQHASRMGSKILPWSYVVNTARYFNQAALEQRDQELLPPATFTTREPRQKEVVVLVIGEAARAENFSLYGYAKDTNPFTAVTSLIALPAGESCATNTISSTACILTHEGRAASSHTKFEPLPSYLTRSGVETIYRTNNSGPPPVNVTTFERAAEIAARCTDLNCPNPHLDEALNWGLADLLKRSTAKRIFVTLHQSGSHGPAYASKYPPEFAHFQPECKTLQVANCSYADLLNSYDNSIRYTDFLLADLIAQLSMVDADTALIYVSDHGQSLGEGGFYLHGLPNSVAPRQQREVPFLVWMSEGFKAHRGLSAQDVIRNEAFPHDFPFHSVMGAFGMRSDIYKPEYDIFGGSN